jgi:hypothetical protein
MNRRTAAGLHFRGESVDLATPSGWQFEDSLSDQFNFVPTGEENERLQFLRSEDGVDVFFDRKTGLEVCIGRTR